METGRQRIKTNPQRDRIRMNDLYVSKRTRRNAAVKRGLDLLDTKKVDSVRVHGLGAAVHAAVLVALEMKKQRPDTIVLRTETGTVKVRDQWLSETSAEPLYTSRFNSCICIHIHYKNEKDNQA